MLKKIILKTLSLCLLCLPSLPAAVGPSFAAPTTAQKAQQKAQTKSGKLVKVLLIKQSNNYFGQTEIYLGTNEAKLIGREGNNIIYCKAPDWKVLVYSKNNNLGCEIPLRDWQAQGMKVVKSRVDLTKGRYTETYDPVLKLACRQTTMKGGGRYFGSDDPMIFRSLSKQSLSEVRYKYTRNLPISPNASKFLQGLYDMSTVDGLPLELINKFSTGNETYLYKTESIKEAEVPAESFDFPKKYRKVNSLGDLLLNSVDKKKVNDLIDSLIDEEADLKKKN